MTMHLVSITIGPVQDFIAQARRSRDLWFGSHLLSELARAAAKAAAEKGAKLVFPALEKGEPELEPCDGMVRETTNQPPVAIANKLLFTSDSLELAQQHVTAAKAALNARWLGFARQAWHQRADLISHDIKPVWDEQVDTIIEVYAAAVEIGGDLTTARELLDSELAARKNLRTFQQLKHHRAGAPKSSLDGGRVSVLRKPADSTGPRRTYRIPQNEHLDAIGVIKRTMGRPEQFVPIANVALASWLQDYRTTSPRNGESLDALQSMMGRSSFGPAFGTVAARTPAGKQFQTDAQVLLEGRLDALLAESGYGTGGATDAEVIDLRKAIRDVVTGGQPSSYVAVLVADGDSMGAALNRLRTLGELQQFSKHLSQFAQDARRIVEEDSLGSLLYAGGDDVVAFLPLPRALSCANLLRERFAKLMSPGQALPPTWEYACPTLSVGLGIGHVLSGMGNLLELGRSAEKLAKGTHLAEELRRNALAVILDKRSGGTLSWRQQWSNHALTEIEQAIARTGNDENTAVLPATKLAEIRRDLARYPQPDAINVDTDATWRQHVNLDVARTLRRANRSPSANEYSTRASNDELLLRFGIRADSTSYRKLLYELNAWVDLHLIARDFVRAQF